MLRQSKDYCNWINVRIIMKNIIKTAIFFTLVIAVLSGIILGFVSSGLIENEQNYIGTDNVNLETDEINLGNETQKQSIIDDNKILSSTATLYIGNENEIVSSLGSAFLYTDKHLITNEHVVRDQDTVLINYYDGKWSKGKVIGKDEHTDIAVIEASQVPNKSSPLPIQTKLPNVGDPVFAVGSPTGLDDSVTSGVISAIERNTKIDTKYSIPDTIQTDVGLRGGSSGGPLINRTNGAVVGVNRATEGQYIGYSVSARIADHTAKSLIDNGEHNHSFIGFKTLNYNPITGDNFNFDRDVVNGVVVARTLNETPADGMFITSNNSDTPDIIKSIDGNRIYDNEDLSSYLILNTKPGDSVTFEVYRDGETVEVDLTMDSRESFSRE